MRSITDSFEIPFIETRWNYRSQKVIGSSGGYAFNLHPDITTLGGAYLDVLEAYHWETITILYQVRIELNWVVLGSIRKLGISTADRSDRSFFPTEKGISPFTNQKK